MEGVVAVEVVDGADGAVVGAAVIDSVGVVEPSTPCGPSSIESEPDPGFMSPTRLISSSPLSNAPTVINCCGVDKGSVVNVDRSSFLSRGDGGYCSLIGVDVDGDVGDDKDGEEDDGGDVGFSPWSSCAVVLAVVAPVGG